MKSKFLLALALLGSGAFAAFADGYIDGVEYYQVGQAKNAEIVLNKTLNDAETNKAEAYYYLGCIALEKGDKAAAEEWFNKGIAANAEYAYNYVGKGVLALQSNNTSAAEDLFKEAEKIDKKDAAVKIEIARAYYKTDKVKFNKEWNEFVKKAKKANKKDASIYVFEGDVYADQQNYGDSAGYYEMATMFDSGRTIAYVKYANTYFRINPSASIDKLREIVSQKPNSLLAQRELAEKLYENDQWTLAADEYKKVVENPNHFASDEERYAVLLYFGKKYEESLARAEQQLQKNPSSFLMKRMRFINAAALERWADAEKFATPFFASTGENNLFSANDYTTYGEVLKKLGKQEEALDAFQKAVDVNPDKLETLKDLSSAYQSAGIEETDSVKRAKYFVKSAECYQKFVDKGDPSTNDKYVLASKYINIIATALTEEEKEAALNKGLTVIDEVLALVPDDYRIAQRKARLYVAKEGRNMKAGLAMDAYKKTEEIINANTELEAEKKNEALKEIYMYYANYYMSNTGKDNPEADAYKANAKLYYQKYLELDPTNDALRKYIETMK